MIEIGKINRLTIAKKLDNQCYLDGGELGELVLVDVANAARQIGDNVEVFVYIDGKNQTVATTQKPKAQVDEVAWLKVVSLSHAGAFLDWGLPKICFAVQRTKRQAGGGALLSSAFVSG